MILITYKKNISLLTKTTLFEIFKKKKKKKVIMSLKVVWFINFFVILVLKMLHVTGHAFINIVK